MGVYLLEVLLQLKLALMHLQCQVVVLRFKLAYSPLLLGNLRLKGMLLSLNLALLCQKLGVKLLSKL